jgi:hypothetical protein
MPIVDQQVIVQIPEEELAALAPDRADGEPRGSAPRLPFYRPQVIRVEGRQARLTGLGWSRQIHIA